MQQERRLLALAISIGLAFLASAGGLLVGGEAYSGWYAALAKPSWTPPGWIFGPVWTLLYLAMAVAAWRVWSRGAREGRAALWLYGAQLAVNAAWTPVFFGLQRPGAAFAIIVLLLALVVATAAAFWRRDRLAGLLFVPYAAWVAFATALNLAIWRLNAG